MVSRSSALESNYPIGLNDRNKKKQIQLSEIKNLQLIQVAAWPNTLNAVGSSISKHLNLDEYALPNKVIVNSSIAMMRIEPLKWWIIGSDIPEILTKEGTKLDLSHSFTQIEISGSDSTIFLNRHLPIDLRDNYFPVNSVVSSAIHHVSVKLWRSTNGYQLFIPRGFALSLWEIFLETARQFIFEVK